MDLGAATNPVGELQLMGTVVNSNGTGESLSSGFLSLGAPLGDGIIQALANQEVAAFDTLGAPFWFDVNKFTIPFSGTTIASGLNHFLNPVQASPIPDGWQFALRKNAPAWETGHLSLTDGATRFTVKESHGLTATLFQDPGDLHGLSLSWTPTGFDALTLEAGYLNEEGSLLGSQGAGAFGSLSGDTLFFGAGYNATAGDWQLGARGELGHVAPSVGQGLFIDNVSSLTTSVFHLQASRPFTNGVTLSFSLGHSLYGWKTAMPIFLYR